MLPASRQRQLRETPLRGEPLHEGFMDTLRAFFTRQGDSFASRFGSEGTVINNIEYATQHELYGLLLIGMIAMTIILLTLAYKISLRLHLQKEV